MTPDAPITLFCCLFATVAGDLVQCGNTS